MEFYLEYNYNSLTVKDVLFYCSAELIARSLINHIFRYNPNYLQNLAVQTVGYICQLYS